LLLPAGRERHGAGRLIPTRQEQLVTAHRQLPLSGCEQPPYVIVL
jgi:hypothetical protein